MFEDDDKVVAYDMTFKTAGGDMRTMICVYSAFGDMEEQLATAIESGRYDNCRIMTFRELDETDRELTLSTGVYEVSKDTFYEMLNVLPPLKWVDRINEKHNVKVNEFCMSEFDHSVFTDQYARAFIDGKTRYYGALVDYFDESTWIHNRI